MIRRNLIVGVFEKLVLIYFEDKVQGTGGYEWLLTARDEMKAVEEEHSTLRTS